MTQIIREKGETLSGSHSECLQQTLLEGGIVIHPFDTVYGLIAKAFDETAYHRLNAIKGERSLPYGLVFDSVDSLKKWYGEIDVIRGRVIDQLLPGPVTLILPHRADLAEGFRYSRHGVGVRVSADKNIVDITRFIGAPIWATSTNRQGELAPVNFEEINKAIVEEVDLAIDLGPTTYRAASTVVDLRERPFTIKRSGPWELRIQNALERAESPVRVMVVCTGNTCRSPLGEKLLQQAVGETALSGIEVFSAGTAAPKGKPPALEMVVLGKLWGVDLTKHQTKQISDEMLDNVDFILAMEPHHADWIKQIAPEIAGKVRLFGELISTEVIPDPFMGSEIDYRESADLIKNSTKAWGDYFKRIVPTPMGRVESGE